MRGSKIILLFFLILIVCSLNVQASGGKKNYVSSLGDTIQDFSLQNIDGNYLSLKSYPEAKGFIIVFTCNHCPFAKLYSERFNVMAEKYGALNVPLLAINPMDTVVYEEESFIGMQEKAKASSFSFPYLQDNLQTVAKDFNADHTPHAFVIWKENNQWIIKYTGAIDDNGAEADKVKNHYLTIAVDDLLARKKIQEPETRSIGCAVFYRK
jgi:peroxiredoxin